jgi:hypothetical protein
VSSFEIPWLESVLNGHNSTTRESHSVKCHWLNCSKNVEKSHLWMRRHAAFHPICGFSSEFAGNKAPWKQQQLRLSKQKINKQILRAFYCRVHSSAALGNSSKCPRWLCFVLGRSLCQQIKCITDPTKTDAGADAVEPHLWTHFSVTQLMLLLRCCVPKSLKRLKNTNLRN